MTNYDIHIVSDTVCPWCFVGHKRLTTAIKNHKQTFPDDTFRTTWKPYQLNPDAPKTGIDKRGYYASKFGEANIGPMFARLSGVGEEAGIAFKFGGKLGNTRDSHRLIEYGRTREGKGAEADKGLQTRIVEALFRGYFEEEQDITSHDFLRKSGITAGLSEAEVNKVLKSDEGGAVVDREVKEARDGGVSGVPYFEINDTYAVEGAQESAAFEALFRRLKEGKVETA